MFDMFVLREQYRKVSATEIPILGQMKEKDPLPHFPTLSAACEVDNYSFPHIHKVEINAYYLFQDFLLLEQRLLRV